MPKADGSDARGRKNERRIKRKKNLSIESTLNVIHKVNFP